jgi:hypothetical protein
MGDRSELEKDAPTLKVSDENITVANKKRATRGNDRRVIFLIGKDIATKAVTTRISQVASTNIQCG